MNTNLSSNFHFVRSPPKPRREITPTLELNCDWLNNPDIWDKEKFTKDIVTFIEQSQGLNAYPNMVLIGMLTHQIDIYVKCSHEMTQNGLVAEYNKGITSGPSLYFSMADKALNRVIQIMKELGLTPSHRIGTVRAITAESLAMDAFLAGP